MRVRPRDGIVAPALHDRPSEQQEQAREDDEQRHEAEERSSPAGNVVYLAVQKEGEVDGCARLVGPGSRNVDGLDESVLFVAPEEKPAP